MATNAPSALVRDLQAALGERHVLWAPEDLLVYEYDASIDRARPDVAVFPGDAEETAAVVRIANKHDVPIVPRGSGTGFAGGAIAVQGGVLVVTTRMNRILEADAEKRVAD